MACSRTPKCRLRPPGLSACRWPASGKVRSVLVEGAQGLAVGRGGVLLLGRTVRDVAVDDDEGGALGGRGGRVERRLDRPEVVGVRDVQHVPAVGAKAGADVFAER